VFGSRDGQSEISRHTPPRVSCKAPNASMTLGSNCVPEFLRMMLHDF